MDTPTTVVSTTATMFDIAGAVEEMVGQVVSFDGHSWTVFATKPAFEAAADR